MSVLEYPARLREAVEELHRSCKITTRLREELKGGKSGAYVALVDAEGEHDGLYVLKAGPVPEGYEDEESRHRVAWKQRAFRGKIPELKGSARADGHYVLLLELAGRTRIYWRPLVESIGLFGSGYQRLAGVLWPESPKLADKSLSPRLLVSSWLDYMLVPDRGGRILPNTESYLGAEFKTAPAFAHRNKVLPNPLFFCSDPAVDKSVIRPISGPFHGDCHALNVFCKAGLNHEIIDISLIDLASYKPELPLFYDCAYFELAALLRQLKGTSLARWCQLVDCLAREDSKTSLPQEDRGWLSDILDGRRVVFSKAKRSFSNRADDLLLQFVLAEVAAGLGFLNKRAAIAGGGSDGLNRDQYQQAFLWSAYFLDKFYDLSRLQRPAVPDLLPSLGQPRHTDTGPVLTDSDWSAVSGFDDRGFNILVLAPEARAEKAILTEHGSELLALNWNLILDFGTTALESDIFVQASRLPRESWAGTADNQLGVMHRGTIWYFLNGRRDLSEPSPATSPREWRQKYLGHLQNLLGTIRKRLSPSKVRVLVLGEFSESTYLRHISEAIDTAFGELLAPIIVVPPHPQEISDVPSVHASVDALLEQIFLKTGPIHQLPVEIRIPRRGEKGTRLEPVPEEAARRISRDMTVVHRNLSLRLPSGRTFGVDFRRGMRVEWSEIAQHLDVPRTKQEDYAKLIRTAAGLPNPDSSHSSEPESKGEGVRIATVNLLHEPSCGGTTLSRQLAWHFMEDIPVVILDQLTEDTHAYIYTLFRFSGLPVLVVMESEVVTASQRESLLEQLREDNTRAVLLWVARMYTPLHDLILSGRLDDTEAQNFRDAYIEQLPDDDERRQQLISLARAPQYDKQRSPFFFGLTAFGEKFLGLDRLIATTLDTAPDETARALLADLALVSYYSSEGFPTQEFDELCEKLNSGMRPFLAESPLCIETEGHVRMPHRLIAESMLRALARKQENWQADLHLYASKLLDHISILTNTTSDRLMRMVDIVFVTRDTQSSLAHDVDIEGGSLGRQNRFSPLITDIGQAEAARALLKRVAELWPQESHYAVHYARHYLHDQPRSVSDAMSIATKVEASESGNTDDTVAHTVGMCFRERMKDTITAALREHNTFERVAQSIRSDFEAAVSKFQRAIELNPGSEYGDVSLIQTITTLLRNCARLAGSGDNLAEFLREQDRRWCVSALALGEEHVARLESRPRQKASLRAQRVIAEWRLVYGNIEAVVRQLHYLSGRYNDPDIRRALAGAIIQQYQGEWTKVPQSELRSIASDMERNIQTQSVKDNDVRLWFKAYRNLTEFDPSVAIQRLLDWHSLNSTSVEPPFYLYVLYFVQWLNSAKSSEKRNSGYVAEVRRWMGVSEHNRGIGARAWGFEWLIDSDVGYRLRHFRDLGFDPVGVLRREPEQMQFEEEMERTLARLPGTIVNYQGPQRAELDLGQGIRIPFQPRDVVNKDHLGRRASILVAFNYDGPFGRDIRLLER